MDRKEFLTLIKKLASFGSDEVTEVETPAVELTEEQEAPEVEATPEVVAEVEVEAAPEEVVAEVEAEAPAIEYATKEELNELRGLVDEYKSLFSKQVEKVEAEKVELQKQLDDKPDAEAIVPAPSVELKVAPATTKKGRIYQSLNNM